MQVFKGQTEDFKFCSKYNEKPPDGFKQSSDMIRFVYLKDEPGCFVEKCQG